MAQKIYYDPVNEKRGVDLTGVKDEAAFKAEFGLGVSTQVIEIDESFEATETVGGILQKFDYVTRSANATAAAATARASKRTALLAKLNAGRTGPNLTEQDLDDLVA